MQLDLLMRTRIAVGIPLSNKYVFAQAVSDMPLRSSDCLRSFPLAAGVTNPSSTTSMKLRKHVATMSQIMNLKKNELDMPASLMGQDLFVHRNYYHLLQDCLEMAKVSKIVLAMESGDVENFKGKSLDDNDLETGMKEFILLVLNEFYH
jgi:hypothetical protein